MSIDEALESAREFAAESPLVREWPQQQSGTDLTACFDEWLNAPELPAS